MPGRGGRGSFGEEAHPPILRSPSIKRSFGDLVMIRAVLSRRRGEGFPAVLMKKEKKDNGWILCGLEWLLS